MVTPVLAHNKDEPAKDNKKRHPEIPPGLHHAISRDSCRFCLVYTAKHGHQVLANRYFLAQAYGTKKVHNILADRTVIPRPHIPKKHYDIVIRVTINVYRSKERDRISVHRAVNVNAAKETHRI